MLRSRLWLGKKGTLTHCIGTSGYQYNNTLEFLESSEPFEPVEAAQQPPLKANILLFLLEEKIKTSPLRNNMCPSPQDLPHLPSWPLNL